MTTPKELQSLKEKIAAIQAGNLDVEADNPYIIKCWERLECKEKDCPAHGKLRCWSIAGTCCHDQVKGQHAQELGDCMQCVVFKESCGDELSEIVEQFNLMIKEIKFNLEEQKKKSKEEAKLKRFADLGDMAAVIAHETRNPLHSIGIAVSYLKKMFQGELGTEFLTIIEEETEKLNKLISLFIEFSVPPTLNIQPLDLNSLVQRTVDDFSHRMNKSGVELKINLAEELPMVPCDKQRIRESIENLLKNALEAIQDKGRISVSTRLYNEHVAISVKDNGIGIPEDKKEDVFTPFYTTKVHGPGFGLSILDRTAKEHNGSVEFCSHEGVGSIFSLFLPFDDT